MNPLTLVAESSIKATVVLLAAYGSVAALKRASAASRHLVWTVAVVAMLLLPLLSVVLPGWRVEVPRPLATELTVSASRTSAPVPTAPRQSPLPRSTAGWLLAVWVLGCAVVLMRTTAGTLRVWWMARRSVEVKDERAAELAAQVGLHRPVKLLTCARVAMPMTWGIWRPVILLPQGAAEWPAERQRLVLLHELVHVARRDHWVQMLAQVVCAGYWFHPMVWHAAGRLRQEREQSCDDAVLRLGNKGSAYAEHLLALARSLQGQEEVWSMAVGMAHASHLESRLMALLDPRRDRQGITWRTAILAGLVAAGLTLPLAMVGAQAQGGNAALSGTIYDPSGARVPQAAVTVTNDQGTIKEVTRSDDVGQWSFATLPEGRYTVEIAQPGFRLFRHSGTVTAGSSPSLMVVLQVGSASETLEVVGKRPALPPVAPAAAPHRVRVGGNVQATKLVQMVKPVYPESARQHGIEGSVLLQAVIFKDGSLGSLEVVNKQVDPDLAAAAMDAVRQWRYEPTLLNGQPVEVVTTITVNFRLGD